MKEADSSQSFTPAEYQMAYLDPPATAEGFVAVYGDAARRLSDYILSGTWAPSLPAVRALPSFLATPTPATDQPECTHKLPTEQAHTGGAFGMFCTCTHPKCLGVVVLDGAESQRMPIEFIVQRMARLPRACRVRLCLCRTKNGSVSYSFDCIAGGLAGRPLPLVDKPHLFLHGDEPRLALLHEGCQHVVL